MGQFTLTLLLYVFLLASFVHSASLQQDSLARSDRQLRPAGSNWLCANWIPVGIQANMCRVFCLVFLNRIPSTASGSSYQGCVDGSCSCE